MLRLKNHQAGVSHVVAILFILAIGIIGAVAIRISSAQRLRYTIPTYPTRPTITGSSAICRSNGITLVPPAGQSCSITQDSSGVHCKINGVEVACPASSTGTSTTTGTPGTATNNTNITTTNGSNGSTGSSTCSANGHGITGPSCSITSDSSGTHCYVSGVEKPCDY